MRDKDGQKLATIGRKIFCGRNILFGQDEYLIKIKKGVDIAFVTYVTAALDEIYNDSGDKNNNAVGNGLDFLDFMADLS